jgi:hypothetical protein
MPDPSLGALREKLNTVTVSRLRAAWRASKYQRAIFIAGAAGTAGAAQFWTWPVGTSPTNAQVVGIVATFVVAIAAIGTIIGDRDASKEIAVAQDALKRAETSQERLDEILRLAPDTDRMIALHQATRLMRDAIEQSTVAMTGDETNLVALLLTIAKQQLALAAGFNLADQYTMCVYKARPAADGCRFELHLIEHDRAIPCDKESARVWPEGRGVAGIAFSKSAEIVVEDLATDDAKAIFSTPERELRRDYDDDRYRSIVATPIKVVPDGRPWGMVVATIDRVGHFNHAQEQGLKPEQAIRALAGFAALAVAVIRARDRAHGPSLAVS